MRLRVVSRAVFSQDYKLEVVLLFGQQGPTDEALTLGSLAEQIGAPSPSSLQRPLHDLLEAGFIELVPGPRSDRSKRYRRKDSALWELGRELYARFAHEDEQRLL